MKRFLALALCLLLCAGCSPQEADAPPTPSPSPSPSETAAPTPAPTPAPSPSPAPVKLEKQGGGWAWGTVVDWLELSRGLPSALSDPDAYNAEVTRRLEAWAEEYDISYNLSEEDIDAAVAVARAEVEQWASEPYVRSFEITELAPGKAETLSYWRKHFDVKDTWYPDWTKEEMEQNLIVVVAQYICDYDGTLTPLFSGRRMNQIVLVRGDDGAWTVETSFTEPSVLHYELDGSYEEYLERTGQKN